jgi:hypothetical protein
MSFNNDEPPEGPVTVYPNKDRRRRCEKKSCKRVADLNLKVGTPPGGKDHYCCVPGHWLEVRSVLINRQIKICYAKGAIDRIFERV